MKQKIIVAGVLALFLLSSFVSVLPAKAQTLSFDQAAFTQRQIYHTGDQAAKVKEKVETKVENEIWKTMVLTASVALRSIALYLAKSAAESAVETIATGDWGKGPLFETQGWKEMLKSEYEYAAGNVIEYFAEDIYAALGFDICAPKIDFKIWLTTSLGQMHDLIPRQQPYCTPTNVLDNWENFADEWHNKFKNPEAASLTALDTVALAFAPTKSPFGLYLTLNDQIMYQAAEEQSAKEMERQEARGWKVQKNQFGNKVVAPASVTSGMAERDIVRAEEYPGESYDVATSVIGEIPGQMLSTFVNTLMSRGILEAIRKAIIRGFASASESYNPKEKVYEAEKGTEKAILALKTVNVAYSYKEINLLEEFNFCPNASAAGNNIPSINNCVLDENFYKAVTESSSGKALTVQEAINQQYLHAEWPLIPQGDERNTNSECYMQGYCYGNLVKLRKARILPVGWEIAAKISEQKGTPVTLGDAIKSFYDSKSSWYHLVDPNWLLMAPLQRCRVQGYNDMLFAKGGDSRQEICVDTQDCVRVDENGKCVGGWGYCRAEENVWKLDGEKCPGYYDSCLNLVRRDGKVFDYLKNTLVENSLTCNEKNVGCKWYSTWKIANNWVQDNQYRLLANAKLTEKSCAPSAEGCSNFIEERPGIGLNILPNGDFEDTSATSTFPGWHSDDDKSTLTIIKDTVFSGSQAIKVQVPSPNAGWEGLQTNDKEGDVINIAPQPIPRFFVFSGYILVPGDLTGTWQVEPHYVKGNTNLAGKKKDGDYTWDNSTPKNQWIRKYIVIETDPYVSGLRLAFTTNKGFGTIYVDAAMIEEIDPLSQGLVASIFKPYGEGGEAFLKRAPDYNKCYNMMDDNGVELANVVGTPYLRKNIKIDDDANACGKFAKMCSADEVGCEQFTNQQTGESIIGAPSYYDYCPSTCAGYDVFEQMASNFEAGVFPFYMIPQKAQTCSAQQAGCDEFTNLDVVAKGGEGKEYYSELRLCHKPVPDVKSDPVCAPFYTWTGSDVSGYQLLAYTLRDEDKNGQPDITTKDDSTFCNQTVYNQNLTNRKVSDCREFYSDAGLKSYHLYTKTITCSLDCHPYRRTIGNKADCESFGGSWENDVCIYMAVPKEGKICGKASAGCREYQGSQAGNVESVFNATFEQEAIKIPAEINVQNDLCNPAKTYIVGSALVTPIVWNGSAAVQTCEFKEHNTTKELAKSAMCDYAGYYWQDSTQKCLEFEPAVFGTYQAWKPGVVSTESLYSGGHSLLLDTNVQATETELTGKIFAGKKYRLSFWAEHNLAPNTQAVVGVKVLGDGGASLSVNTAVTLQNDNEWHYYATKDFAV
ncbi:hypothetical protein HY932_03005, partial [Candidatus Falkowbacteria bacterium]|nr:hypothetical protein [Candidatus Falkowbacteria bacterium]